MPLTLVPLDPPAPLPVLTPRLPEPPVEPAYAYRLVDRPAVPSALPRPPLPFGAHAGVEL